MKNLSLLFLTFLFFQLSTLAQWDQLEDIPTARYFLSGCTLDGKIYVMGGTESTSSTGPSFGTIEVYDPILDSWDITKADMPASRVEFCVCAVNGKIYVIGGAPNHGGSPLGTVEEYDASTDTWSTKTPMQTARYGCAYGVIDNKIYVAGGTVDDNFTTSNILEIYDPVTDSWDITKAAMQQPIYQPQGAFLNGKFYVIGGLIGTPWTGQKTVQMYDPTTDTWSLVASLNEGRVGHTVNAVDGKLYVIGGDTQPPPLKSVEEYDPNLNTWTNIGDAPFFKNCHTASLFDNKIYLFGGSTTTIFPVATPTNTVYSFDPSYLDTIHVPADYATIQEAIDAANNGNTVLVADGTYLENINFKGKAITVASHFLNDGNEAHIENTVIDGSQPANPDTGSVVSFLNGEDTSSVLCGFTITGGTGNYSLTFDVRAAGGIGVYLSGAKICNNIIEYNSVTHTNALGGGIQVYAPDGDIVIIRNNIIKNNYLNGTYPYGGGISLGNSGLTYIVANKIIDNNAIGSYASGGGIDVTASHHQVIIKNNYIKGNITSLNGYGGGGIDLFQWEAPVFVSNNLIVDNSGNWGGGVLVDYPVSGSLKTANLNVEDFSGTKKESTLYKLLQDIPVLVNNTIINNYGTIGGGIYTRNSTPDVMNSIVWGNNYTSGGQIRGTATVTYSDVEGGYTGTGNIDVNPEFDPTSDYYALLSSSQCVDAGNPDAMYNDIEDPNNPGNAFPPAFGTLTNDMGHCGGPASLWGSWGWPILILLIHQPLLNMELKN
jgi:N-acetylneuraminic acid mutarotase